MFEEKNYVVNDFQMLADKILNKARLVANTKEYKICEIEMYLRNNDHDDKYVHGHDDQKQFGKFYFHRYQNGTYKAGTYKGLDIVLGNNNSYFGILIRTLYDSDTNKFIEGSCRCVNEILQQFNVTDVKELMNTHFDNKQIEIINNKLYLKNYNGITFDIYTGPRIGLSDKYTEYKNKNYRFVIMEYGVKKQKKTLTLLKKA